MSRNARSVILVEPAYRSKFPPLGLLRIGSYHRGLSDDVAFVRGKTQIGNRVPDIIYISSLFTWELPRTVDTIRYYLRAVPDSRHIVVGGVAASLLPEYITARVPCRIVRGSIDRKGRLETGSPALVNFTPDYSLLDSVNYHYKPQDSYFGRTTVGCIRRCSYCAVSELERRFGTVSGWWHQIEDASAKYGEKQHLVLLDNNVLAAHNLDSILAHVVELGFGRGAKRDGKRRTVDFNQGIDARLVTRSTAAGLSRVNLIPVRLAFDTDSMEKQYRRAIRFLADVGFTKFTNYMMYNNSDTPESLYRRMRINHELSDECGVEITGFPMRYIPIRDISRQYVSESWHWRYLRGTQCVLRATRGLVSPNHAFFDGAFGSSVDEFKEIIAMPDRYIMFRSKYADNGMKDWRRRYRRLSPTGREEFLGILYALNKNRKKEVDARTQKRFGALLEHYYPDGKVVRQ